MNYWFIVILVMNISKKTFHKWSCKCSSNISPAVLSRFWLSCAESTNWNWGLFSKCHAVCDFGSLGVHPWSFMCTLFLQWLQSWGSSGTLLVLTRKAAFYFSDPFHLALQEKTNAFGNSILCCENTRKTCTPKVSLQGKRAENNAGCYSNGRYKILGYFVEYDQFLVITGRPNHQNKI